MSIREELLKKLELDPTRFTPDQIKNAIESGIIPGYVGFPLIDEIVRAKQQAKMQQAAQQLQQSQNPPVVQQILARANQLQGIDNLQSNLPAQGYAPGGIVAFDGGGEVKRFQTAGLVDSSPAGRWWESVSPWSAEKQEAAEIRRRLQQRYGIPSAPIGGLFVRQTDEERQRAKDVMARLNSLSLPELRQLDSTGVLPPAYSTSQPPMPGAPKVPTAAPAPAPTPTPTPQLGRGIQMQSSSAALSDKALGLDAPPTPFSYSGPSMRDETSRILYGTEADPGLVGQMGAAEAEAEAKRREAAGKVTGKAYEEYEKGLREESGQTEEDRKTLQAKTLLNLGLGLMQAKPGETFFGSLGRAGEGAFGYYESAMKDIRKAERERRKELANIEQARRAEAIGDRDKEFAAIDKAQQARVEMHKFVAQALQQATGLDYQQAFQIAVKNYDSARDWNKTLVEARLRREQILSQERGVNAGLAQRGEIARAQLAANEQRFGLLAGRMAAMQAETLRKAVKDWDGSQAKATAEKEAKTMAPHLAQQHIEQARNRFISGYANADSAGLGAGLRIRDYDELE